MNERMNKDSLHAFLNSVLECRMESSRLRRKMTILEERALSMTSQLSGMPRGGNADRNAVLAALADATSEYYAQLVDSISRELEVSAFINSLPTMEHRIIMRLRYIDRMRWSKVLAALNAAGLDLSERQMFRLHGAALREARELYDKQYKENNDDQS